MSEKQPVKRIPIRVARDVAREFRQSQVILLAWDKRSGLTHVVTCGETREDCEQAAEGGNRLKRALGWPEEECNAEPAHVRRRRRLDRLRGEGEET